MPIAKQTELHIDLNGLGHNFRYITSKLKPETKVLAVVKAGGYGSNACEVALELEKLGVAYFAVAYVNEGISLRDAGVSTPILVLHPQACNFDVLIERCLEPALYSPRILKAFIASAEKNNQTEYPVHLKFNTGLNRLGFWENDTPWIEEQIRNTKSIHIKSIFSHLAASEDMAERDFTLNQIEHFKKISKDVANRIGYQPMLHQSNTSAIINYPEAEFDMVRTGIGLYGYGNSSEEDELLRPVVTLKSIISQIHKIEPGETVGYNRAYKAEAYETTATIPIGHADGIPRSLGNEKGCVLVNGKKAPIIGNVCMDMLMINITGIDCKEGDEVVLIGDEQPATVFAKAANTISYEILTALSQRIKRVTWRKP